MSSKSLAAQLFAAAPAISEKLHLVVDSALVGAAEREIVDHFLHEVAKNLREHSDRVDVDFAAAARERHRQIAESKARTRAASYAVTSEVPLTPKTTVVPRATWKAAAEAIGREILAGKPVLRGPKLRDAILRTMSQRGIVLEESVS